MSRTRVRNLQSRVWGLGFGVLGFWGLGFRVWVLGGGGAVPGTLQFSTLSGLYLLGAPYLDLLSTRPKYPLFGAL